VERVLIVMLSDGAPVYAEGKKGFGHTRAVVNRLRRKGAAVVSVSIAYALRKDAQANMYGHDGYVEFDKNWRTLASSIGRVIGHALN
jgi:nitric oxide reductase activation protein